MIVVDVEHQTQLPSFAILLSVRDLSLVDVVDQASLGDEFATHLGRLDVPSANFTPFVVEKDMVVADGGAIHNRKVVYLRTDDSV